MSDVKQKLIDAVQLEEKKIQASREKFELEWVDGVAVTNSELANKTNLHNAYHNADYGPEDSAGVVDLGAGSDVFHFGGWGGGAADGPLLVDMGEEKIDGNPYGDDFQLRKGLTKDNDVVFLRKTVDKYRFEYDGDNDQIGVEDLESQQVVIFQNVEQFRVDGLKVDGSRAEEYISEGGFGFMLDGMSPMQSLYMSLIHMQSEAFDEVDITEDPNFLNVQLAHQILEDGEPEDYVDGNTIVTGELNDRFHFGEYAEKADTDLSVDMGDGVDVVGLRKSIEDYTIEVLKSDDGDSVTYDAIAFTDDVSGQKITFSGADKFVFHNIVDGVNYTNDNFSFGELVDSVDVIEDAKEDIIEDDFTLAMYAQFATGTGAFAEHAQGVVDAHNEGVILQDVQITEADIA